MSETRTRWLLILLVLGQLFLLAAQLPEAESRRSFLETAVLRVIAPFANVITAGARLGEAAVRDLALRRTLVAENKRLRSEVEELRQRMIQLEGLKESLRHLSEAVEYADGAQYPLVVADIVFIDHTSWLQTLVLAVREGAVAVNQPVVVSEGLVGRVVVASGPYAKVQLITDRSASVGGMIERTHRQGVVRGAGRGSLQLDFVPQQADVRVGDVVLTAGIDGIYPRGIPIGTVVEVAPGSELFHSIRLSPSVDFGVVDVVYLIEREPVPETVKEALPDAQP